MTAATGAAGQPRRFPGTLHLLETVDSTNRLARDYAQDGAPEGLAILAQAQTGGRGRDGRAWVSPPGNLYLSVILRPPRPVQEVPQLSLAAGVAVYDAVATRFDAQSQPALRLKWPNDLLHQSAKLGGILLESGLSGSDTPAWVVAGIGINVTNPPQLSDRPATALAERVADPPTPLSLAETVLESLWQRYLQWQAEGFAPIRSAWRQRGTRPGEAVQIRTPQSQIETLIFSDLDADGSLLAKTPCGQQRRIHCGDILPN